jgi:hypothetical protein
MTSPRRCAIFTQIFARGSHWHARGFDILDSLLIARVVIMKSGRGNKGT